MSNKLKFTVSGINVNSEYSTKVETTVEAENIPSAVTYFERDLFPEYKAYSVSIYSGEIRYKFAPPTP